MNEKTLLSQSWLFPIEVKNCEQFLGIVSPKKSISVCYLAFFRKKLFEVNICFWEYGNWNCTISVNQVDSLRTFNKNFFDKQLHSYL